MLTRISNLVRSTSVLALERYSTRVCSGFIVRKELKTKKPQSSWSHNFSNGQFKYREANSCGRKFGESIRFASTASPSSTSPTESNSAKKGYYEREIAWPSSVADTLKFRTTVSGLSGYTDAENVNKYKLDAEELEDKHQLGTDELEAPFFNRVHLLESMLRANFQNFFFAGKPMYSLQAMGRGSGKTRMLVEWLYQAFAKGVPSKLLQDKSLAPISNEVKRFLNLLYYSHYRQYTIFCSGQAIDVNWPAEEAVQQLVRLALLQLFNNQEVVLNNSLITINQQSAEAWFSLAPNSVPSVSSMLDLFIALCNKVHDEPPNLPYPEIGVPKKKKGFVFFIIDECQLYSEQRVTKPDLIYTLFTTAANANQGCLSDGIFPFWSAAGTWTPGTIPTLASSRTRYELVDATLDNLLALEHLSEICTKYFKHRLHFSFMPTEKLSPTAQQMPMFSLEISRCLVRNFLQTFGVPRVIENFVRFCYKALPQILKDTDVSKEKLQFGRKAALKSRLATLDVGLHASVMRLFTPVSELSGVSYEELNIKAALCSELAVEKDIFPSIPSRPKELVGTGILLLWDRQGVHHFYTRPFFSFSEDQLNAPLKSLCISDSTNSYHPYWEPVRPTLASIIVEREFAGLLYDSAKDKGEAFENALAITLYARYILCKGSKNPVTFADLWVVPPEMEQEVKLFRSLLEAKVNLKGVVTLTKTIGPDTAYILDELARSKFIAIDVGNSASADVLVPVTVGNKTIIVGFQCKQYRSKPDQASYVNNATRFLQLHRCQVWFGVAPVNPGTPQLAALNDAKHVAIAVEASALMSPLYQVGMTMVPPEFKLLREDLDSPAEEDK